MDKWEYKVVSRKAEGWVTKDIPDEPTAEALNELGAEGWELVSVAPITGEAFTTKSVMLFLKRRLD